MEKCNPPAHFTSSTASGFVMGQTCFVPSGSNTKLGLKDCELKLYVFVMCHIVQTSQWSNLPMGIQSPFLFGFLCIAMEVAGLLKTAIEREKGHLELRTAEDFPPHQ